MSESRSVLRRFAAWLARVTAVEVGRPPDGLVRIERSGTDLDKAWEVLHREFVDAREAWRRNPLARRLVAIVTSYVVGDGIRVAAQEAGEDAALSEYLERFWTHDKNQMGLRQYQLCDELTRSGELFITLHFNPADGMSYVRALPASSIDRVEYDPGDYERELAYHEAVGVEDPDYPEGRVWYSPAMSSRAPVHLRK